MPVLDPQALIDDRVRAIHSFHAHVGSKVAELDVSGGVDSATLLGLLSKAIGPEQIIAVYTSIHSSTDSRDRAREAAAAFGVQLIELDLTEIFDTLTKDMRAALIAAGRDTEEVDARLRRDPTVLGSIRSCLRAPVGRGFNRMGGGGIRHGTGNECEDRWLRFYQKGGDGEVDTNPIAMLSKGEVYQLAKALGVPRSIIDALPSPDLHGVGEAHNDEDEIRALSGVDWTYSRIDWETGKYTKVGTIEILSRFLDQHPELLRDAELPEQELERLAKAAEPLFRRNHAVTLTFLESARALEKMTRHKANPNCPSLGSRAPLIEAGVLDNALPEV
ncbi:NAD(+) synthase [Pseudenhygromyxa sp. WMMC2535]|uniref:NAD(+) synthase n=1 Tax=Pseudenhygromyxa sp. WMMC2535 TaxID=2712867 RepID=UPI0015535FC2|nr:NAD(+) synthase [Pseudenhygromyxa sp. WMMC2535]NVB42538.1 NAD(+) synthase [Pseudenhygromyxa sp. WMMC2535]